MMQLLREQKWKEKLRAWKQKLNWKEKCTKPLDFRKYINLIKKKTFTSTKKCFLQIKKNFFYNYSLKRLTNITLFMSENFQTLKKRNLV